MILYLDTSALAKLFISEPGSVNVAAAVSSALAVATHRIAYVEMHATLGRAVRMNRIAASSLEPRLREFETRWVSLEVVDLTDPMARRAATLAIRHGLRGYDSVHLAAALAVQDALAVSEPVTFGASDLRLTEAATMAGLGLLPLFGYIYGDQPLESFLNPGEERLLIDFDEGGGIPAIIAGGVGGSDVAGRDSRIITSGIVRIAAPSRASMMQSDPSIPPSRLSQDAIYTQLILIINFEVRDTIDFCPGQCGSPPEQLATIKLSRLEATGFAYDVPFTVNFPLRVSKTTRLPSRLSQESLGISLPAGP